MPPFGPFTLIFGPLADRFGGDVTCLLQHVCRRRHREVCEWKSPHHPGLRGGLHLGRRHHRFDPASVFKWVFRNDSTHDKHGDRISPPPMKQSVQDRRARQYGDFHVPPGSIVFTTTTGLASASRVPCLASLLDEKIHQTESRQGIGPPPTKEMVEHEAGK